MTLTQERVSSKHSVDLAQFVSDLKNNNINNSSVTFLITGLFRKILERIFVYKHPYMNLLITRGLEALTRMFAFLRLQ